MIQRYRPMQPKDVRECVRIIAEHPVIGARYGKEIAHLGPAWLRILGSDAVTAAVFEELDGAAGTIWGVGVCVCVHPEFLNELKKPPLWWFGPELARRIAQGDSPVLSDRQLREANSSVGLTGICWEGTIRHEFSSRMNLHQYVVEAFLEGVRGYRWEENIAPQVESPERLQWILSAGGRLWCPAEARYIEATTESPAEIVSRPHLVGITREIERKRASTWVGTIFDYRPPRFGLSRAQQKLVLSELHDEAATDEEMAEALLVSLSTVKKTWASIYDRIAAVEPQLVPDWAHGNGESSGRGKEKRRRLLAYFRKHPEELRPVSHKLLASWRPREEDANQ